VLIASGTKEKKLGFPNEDALIGRGISYCALCDGHFFKGLPIAVIGGGNSALKESLHLSHLVSHLYLVHRRNEFRGSEANLKEIKQMPNVTILTPYIPLEIIQDDRVKGLKIRNVETQEEKILQIDGLFPLIGQIPNTQFMKIPGVLDEQGNIPVDKKMMTSVPGLFSGGDVLPRLLRQIYLAEHDGMVAARSIIEYLEGA
ncbi:MAG: FAD-dependent oxidoreductase, partial [Bacilli bacterium]|nr:FAD-dependent oxidoreductase [Bacilli bacterium]